MKQGRQAIKVKGSERQLSVGLVSHQRISIGYINRYGHDRERGLCFGVGHGQGKER